MLVVTKNEDHILTKIKYTITFTITAGVTPVENARIVIQGREEFTDINGNAVFKLTKGTYTYTITHPSYDTVIDTITVTADDTEAVDIGGDPIQALVDAYKAYVASQGGVHGVSDAALYAEYEAMITAGEIQSDGTNTKNVINFGLWGYKKDGDNLITSIWSITKISGNYLSITVNESPLFDTDHINMTKIGGSGVLAFPITYEKSSFYIEMEALIQRGASNGRIITSPEPVSITITTRSSNRMQFNTFDPDNTTFLSNNGMVANSFKTYKVIYNRTLDDLVYEVLVNGSPFQTSTTISWNRVMNERLALVNATADNVFKFKKFKIAIK